MQTINERMKEVRKQLHKTQAEFARELGFGQSGIAEIERSTRNITERHIKAICSIFKVNEDWLRYGKGEIFINDSSTLIEKLSEELNMTQWETNVLAAFLKFSPEDRQKIMDYGQRFVEELIKQREESERQKEKAAIDAEVEAYRKELEAERLNKGKLLVSMDSDGEKNGEKVRA